MIQRMFFVIIVVISRSFGTVLFDIVIFLQLKTEKENFFFSNTAATLPAALFVETKRPLSSNFTLAVFQCNLSRQVARLISSWFYGTSIAFYTLKMLNEKRTDTS